MEEQDSNNMLIVEEGKDDSLTFEPKPDDSMENKKRVILALYLREGAYAGGFERLSNLYTVTKDTMFRWIKECIKEPGRENEKSAFIKRLEQDREEVLQKGSENTIRKYKDVYDAANKMLSAGATWDEIKASLDLDVPTIKKYIRIYIYATVAPEDRQYLPDVIKEAIKDDVYFAVEAQKKNGGSR